MDKPKGKGLALLIGIGRKKAGGFGDDADGSDRENSSSDAVGDKADMAIDDMAEVLGVDEDKREDFADAFKTAVKACMSSEDEEE